MNERKHLNNILGKQIIITLITLSMVILILMGTSYAILGSGDETNKATVNIKVGSMQVVLRSTSEVYTFKEKFQYPVSDASGMSQEPYNFSLSNTGNNDIGYFEIRMINQENKISTLPHKYIRYTVQKGNEKYINPVNLGDVESIIYSGYDFKKDETIDFNLKLWIDENSPKSVYNKELYGALEVTLYQKYDIYDYYVLYDSVGGVNSPFRTNIQEPIASIIPKKENYLFLGWSSTKDGAVEYQPEDKYRENIGRTLYAVWKKLK